MSSSPPITSDQFRALHRTGIFVMPNPWDVGSARYLQNRGFPALATTSSGLAASLGRRDQTVHRDELLAHVETLASAVAVPLNVDSERCYPDEPGGVARTVTLLARAGAAGCSIEDYDPAAGAIEPLDVAVERVAEAAEAASRHGLVLTARCELLLYGHTDLDATIARLRAYHRAGAEVVYAPGPADPALIARLVAEVEAPVNVLARPDGPSVGELEGLGVRRVSTGGALAWAAFRGLAAAVDELTGSGTSSYAAAEPSSRELVATIDPS